VGSFIPPNQLRKLKDSAHNSHPTGLSHQYYVDVPISVADVWLGAGYGTTKSRCDWKILLVFGESRGWTGAPWSFFASCTSDFQNVYSETYSYYCGYFALDITNNYSQIN
jgi:Tfp pilus tip-associated adhesin PilY1